MSLYRKIALVSLIIIAAFAVASISIYRAAQTGASSRKALCQVLLFVRESSLIPQPGDPPLTDRQIDRIEAFYGHLIGLVEGCHIQPPPPKGATR